TATPVHRIPDRLRQFEAALFETPAEEQADQPRAARPARRRRGAVPGDRDGDQAFDQAAEVQPGSAKSLRARTTARTSTEEADKKPAAAAKSTGAGPSGAQGTDDTQPILRPGQKRPEPGKVPHQEVLEAPPTTPL